MKIVHNKQDCTGCTACMYSCPTDAIRMESNEQGFLYPRIEEIKCIKCGICQRICPVDTPLKPNESLYCYAAINSNDRERIASTSGGIFSILSTYVLHKGGVVYGAAYDSTQKVIHIRLTNVEDIPQLRGAKYSQSYLGSTYTRVKEDLSKGLMVLFSGTPCQVGGLKAFLGKEYDNLILVDLVCHGVPSPKAWEKYVEFRKFKDNQPGLASEINLRSKTTGWSRYGYSVLFKYSDGYTYTQKNNIDPYMFSFVNNMTIRPSCNNCHFKNLNRCSDLTLGDFWGIWDIKPEMDDDKGTSLVLVHSQKGKEIWDKIKTKCLVAEVEMKDTYLQNPSLVSSSYLYPGRDELLERLDQEGFVVIIKEVDKIRKQRNKKSSIIKRIWRRIKR